MIVFDLETQYLAAEVGGWGNKELLRLAVASGRMGDKATAEASLAQVASSPGVRPPSEVIDLVHEDVSQASALASAAQGATGASVKELLAGTPRDRRWADDLRDLRSSLPAEVPDWRV